MNRLRSAELSVIVRVHHGVGFDLIEGSVIMEATFDGDFQQSGRTFPAHRNRVNFDERFVWTVDKGTVKSIRTANGVVLVQCFRIPSMPIDHGESYLNNELYERQRVGLAVIQLKEFQVIGRDWDQEVALRYYTLHCGTGHGNVALRMSLVIKDTIVSDVFNKPSAVRPQDRYHRPRDRLSVVTPIDQQQPGASNRPQPAATVKNRQRIRKTTLEQEQYNNTKPLVASYQSVKGKTYDDNTGSMSVNDNTNSMHNHGKSHWMRLHECNYYSHNKNNFGASNATTDDFIKTMEQLTMDMAEVRKKTSQQCKVVDEYANKSGQNLNKATWKYCPRIGGGRGDLDQLNPSEKHRGGTVTAVTSRESLLTMTTASVLSDDTAACVRGMKKSNNMMTNMTRDIRIDKHNVKTSETPAYQSCSSQSDNDMQRPVVLVDELKKSVNQFANCFYHMKKKKRYTNAKYSKGMTVLKKLNSETIKLNEQIRDARLSACNQCCNEAL